MFDSKPISTSQHPIQHPSPITVRATGSPTHFQDHLPAHLATPISHTFSPVYASRVTSPLSQNTTPKSTTVLTVYELAAMEAEKEQLQDRMQLFMAKLEESEAKLLAANRANADLQRTNHSLTKENQILKSRLQEIDVQHQLELLKRNKSSTEDFSEVEFKLAETRAKLARSQQAYEDVIITKDELAKDLEFERSKVGHIERERDAYSAAYEASLKHFEKWAAVRKSSVTKSIASSLSSINPLR